jgi:hypothetical protein
MREASGRRARAPVRLAAFAALACGLLGLPARAQTDMSEEPPTVVRPGGVSCSELNNRAMEATLVIRQHASALSLGFEPDARAQAAVMLAWLDQWSGRLRGLIDLGDFSDCMDDGEAETYRRALVTASRIGNQAREELLRPVRAPQPQGQPQQQRARRP